MPSGTAVGAFVLGSVFLLIAVLGGRFKIFGAEVSGTAGTAGRAVAAVLGAAMVFIGLYATLSPVGHPRDSDESKPGTKITVSYKLVRDVVEGRATIYIGGHWVGYLVVNSEKPFAQFTATLPGPGPYEYSIESSIEVIGYDENHNPLPPETFESNGRGSIEVTDGKEFSVFTNNMRLLPEGGFRWYADLRTTPP